CNVIQFIGHAKRPPLSSQVSMAAGRVSGLLGAPLALQCVGQIWAAQGVTTSSPGSAFQGRRLSTCAENSVSHPSKLRLVQYNVRGFTTPGGACGVDAISRSLHGLQPAIVCLNEVDVSKKPEGLRRLAESAGLPHIHFFGHVGGRPQLHFWMKACVSVKFTFKVVLN
ncbi:unnamed protein product, partial [Polarella glacialis]